MEELMGAGVSMKIYEKERYEAIRQAAIVIQRAQSSAEELARAVRIFSYNIGMMFTFEETGAEISKVDNSPIMVGKLSYTCEECQSRVEVAIPPDKGQRACPGCGTLFVYELKRDADGYPLPMNPEEGL